MPKQGEMMKKIVPIWMICVIASALYATLLHGESLDNDKLSVSHNAALYDSTSYMACDEPPLWAFPFDLHWSFANRSFDHNSQNAPLSTLIFQKPFTIQDIQLFSSLSAENKVRIQNIPPLPPQRPDMLAVMPPFGDFASEQYPNLLAPTQVRINAEEREVGGSLTFMRRLYCDAYQCLKPIVGITVPIINRLHIMDLSLIGGTLLNNVFVPADQTNREDSAMGFFRNFTDVYDYFERGILEPKGLTFQSRQRRTGFGDITLFGFVEWDTCWPFVDLQAGINLICPSGGRIDVNKIWDPVLGNGGAYQLAFSIQGSFCSCYDWFNPVFRAIAQISMPFKHRIRLPVLKQNQTTSRQQANNIAGLLTPPPFGSYFVDNFSQFDSTVPYFGDDSIAVRTRFGPQIFALIGNYFNQPFCLDVRVGIFYEYMRKAQDSVRTICSPCAGVSGVVPIIDQDVAIGYTQEQAHRISWQISHQFTDQLELTFGSYHVVAGKNVAREQRIFLAGLFHF